MLHFGASMPYLLYGCMRAIVVRMFPVHSSFFNDVDSICRDVLSGGSGSNRFQVAGVGFRALSGFIFLP